MSPEAAASDQGGLEWNRFLHKTGNLKAEQQLRRAEADFDVTSGELRGPLGTIEQQCLRLHHDETRHLEGLPK